MVKDEKPQSEKVSSSIAEIYANMISKRNKKLEEKKAEKELEKEAEQESLAEGDDSKQDRPLTKEEKKIASFEKWKDVMVNLTGEDIEYLRPSKKSKKYKKWIDEDDDLNQIAVTKEKKQKKKNYNKEFEHELNMLKLILTDQNKFSVDLAKRYQTMVGPNTKDASPLSKNAIELAAVINASRNNSLSFLKEIGGLKKSIADLTMKDKKLMQELSGSNSGETADLGMMGSNIMSSIFASSAPSVVQSADSSIQPQQNTPQQNTNYGIDNDFNPDTFSIPGFEDSNAFIKYEKVPTKTVVVFDSATDKHRYKTYDTSTNQELLDYPNPEFSIKTIDKESKQAKDTFDTIYELEVI